jgi:hypothetical protein
LTKAQVISGDFIISLSVFIIVIAIILNVYTNVSTKVSQNDDLRNMETISLFASGALAKTSGYPSDWNETNAQVIGLSTDNRLNISKIEKFINMNYSRARELLGFQAYNFNITFYDLDNNILLSGVARNPVAYFYTSTGDMADMVNGSGLVWDIFYGGPGQPFSGDATHIYTGQKEEMFNSMVFNSSLYKTIIIEDPDLTQGDVNVSGLVNFVARGGVLIFEGDADLIQTGFSMHLSNGALTNGVVTSTDDFIDGSVGDIVEFASGTWYAYESAGDTQLKTMVADSNNHAILARWNHALGRVYYLTDENGEINGMDIEPRILIAGRRLEFGLQPHNVNSVSLIQRFGILGERNQPIKFNMVVWK